MSEDTLSGRLLSDASKRPALLSDSERVIQQEVDAKSGLTGLAIKGAYKVVCKVKPGIIRESMDSLLDDFVKRLDPMYAQHLEAGGAPAAFGGYLAARRAEAADALLGITDDRAKGAQNRTLKGTYEKLRPQAKKHVEEAVPRVSELLVRHL
jgi:hypothetical protein